MSAFLGVAPLEQAEQEVELDVAADPVELLGDRVDGQLLGRHLDEGRRVEVGRGHPLRQLVQRGAEEHALAVLALGHLLDDVPEVGQEAHVEEPVGLVDDEEAALLEIEPLLLGQVEEPPRRADDDVRAGLDLGQLDRVADAAVEAADLEPDGPVEEQGLALDLDGQLAGRDDDQGLAPGALGVLEQVREERDEEGGRLAGPGLGLDGHVLALERLGQGQLLDVGQLGVTPVVDGPLEPGIEVEFGETHVNSFSDRGSFLGEGLRIELMKNYFTTNRPFASRKGVPEGLSGPKFRLDNPPPLPYFPLLP